MIDFSTLKSLEIPEGVVTQITDASGNVLWSAVKAGPIVLEVAKITSNTYASSTTYSNEEFILLSITSKSKDSVIKVTYGGLTKTLTFTLGMTRSVYFGTFNGVSDEVETPASGTVIIEGDCIGVGAGSYNTAKSTTAYCKCITGIAEWGGITSIGVYAFYDCDSLALTELPSGITSIGNYAFYDCDSLALTELPSGITSIGNYVFYNCIKLALTELPSGITSIGDNAFRACHSLTLTELPSGITSIGDYALSYCSKLTLAEIPEGVTTIGEGAFTMYYDELNGTHTWSTAMENGTISLPSTITSIGTQAFGYKRAETGSYMSYLSKVIIHATTPPSLGEGAFGNRSSIDEIIVPSGCGAVYKAADGWSAYADVITEASA